MENDTMQAKELIQDVVISSNDLLKHWQGHRSLTRKMIEAFPEEQFFTFSIGGMRPFSELILEMVHMTGPGINGIAYGQWKPFGENQIPDSQKLKTKQEYLDLWDKTTVELNRHWPNIPAGRFQQVEAAFGQYENTIIATIFYFIDNEIHHRGQGYVYLRALGVEPPAFWDR